MATPQPLVIFGIGDFADMVYFYFKHDPAFQVKAFTVDSAYIKEATFHGLPVVPFETVEKEYPPSKHKVFIAMGYTDMNRRRAKRFELVRAKGYTMANYIHPTASIPPDLIMGENCFWM